ncbi:MAG: hypothetical protein ACOYMN_06300, partial [Roseimicrobium sp.]
MAHSPAPHRSSRVLALLLPLLVLALLLWSLDWRSQPNGPGTPVAQTQDGPLSASAKRNPNADAEGRAHEDFRQWLTAHEQLAPNAQSSQAHLADGITAAKARRASLERLMREQPEQALAEALSFEQWAALPEPVQALVEKPFSVTADFHFYPVCTPPGQTRPPGTPDYVADLTLPSGEQLEAIVYGQRRDIMSKRGLPMQGIALGKLAVIREEALQKLPSTSLNTARGLFPQGQTDRAKSFATCSTGNFDFLLP